MTENIPHMQEHHNLQTKFKMISRSFQGFVLNPHKHYKGNHHGRKAPLVDLMNLYALLAYHQQHQKSKTNTSRNLYKRKYNK